MAMLGASGGARAGELREPDSIAPRALTGPLDRRAGGERYGTYRVRDPRRYPARVTGKVFGHFPGFDYSCSGTVVNTRSGSILLTAAHCVRSLSGDWATRFMFVPAYTRGEAPFGKWFWKAYYLPWQWWTLNYDYAAVALRRRGGRTIERRLRAAAGLAWNQRRRQDYRALGYPQNLFFGKRMVGCLSPLRRSDRRAGDPAPVGIRCRMRGGSSGGGWLIDDDAYVNSVTSYSKRGERGILYGPYFTRRVLKLLRFADRRS